MPLTVDKRALASKEAARAFQLAGEIMQAALHRDEVSNMRVAS